MSNPVFQIENSVGSNIESLKYKRFALSGFENAGRYKICGKQSVSLNNYT